jgi:uncharacterized protein (UPF0264 family)
MTATPGQHTGLLVSVRSAEEAEAALAGGADLIDVKEPSRGSLGRADDETIAAVVRTVAGRKPVSAAMGELRRYAGALSNQNVAYGKWGLAGLGNYPERLWQRALEVPFLTRWGLASASRVVVVAYADWTRAEAPLPEVLSAYARREGYGFLLDTFEKDGSTLLDWMPIPKIALLCRSCRNSGVPVALAGSLGVKEIEALRPLKPDWFGVRGAACRGGSREAGVDAERVRELVELLSLQTR